jgi:hypothetical protein
VVFLPQVLEDKPVPPLPPVLVPLRWATIP